MPKWKGLYHGMVCHSLLPNAAWLQVKLVSAPRFAVQAKRSQHCFRCELGNLFYEKPLGLCLKDCVLLFSRSKTRSQNCSFITHEKGFKYFIYLVSDGLYLCAFLSPFLFSSCGSLHDQKLLLFCLKCFLHVK